MPRYRLTLAYDGAAFHGWQAQRRVVDGDVVAPEDADLAQCDARPEEEELRTVQAVLTRAVREVVREPVEIRGASRTDAGVHAAAQCAAFTTFRERSGPPDERLALAINSRLPDDVVVTHAERVIDAFDPISDCDAKGYRYTLHESVLRPLWNRGMVHHVRTPLDVDAMAQAATLLVGEHDFAAFAKAGHGRQTTVRTVHACTVREVARDDLGGRTLAIDISGNGFLHNMVRIVAGTLLEIGRGRLGQGDIRAALETGDRRRAGPTLPPHGLRLEWIRYPERTLYGEQGRDAFLRSIEPPAHTPSEHE